MYLRHVGLLFQPGKEAPVFTAAAIEPAPLAGWNDVELQIMLDEGRREIDDLNAQLTEIRGRAQTVLTIAIAIVGILAGIAGTVDDHDLAQSLWVIGVAFVVLSALGAASILTVRAVLEKIHTPVLSQKAPSVLRGLATDYADMTRVGTNTVATRLTLLWFSVLSLLLGGGFGFASWVVAMYW
jgi:hypothetical protein